MTFWACQKALSCTMFMRPIWSLNLLSGLPVSNACRMNAVTMQLRSVKWFWHPSSLLQYSVTLACSSSISVTKIVNTLNYKRAGYSPGLFYGFYSDESARRFSPAWKIFSGVRVALWCKSGISRFLLKRRPGSAVLPVCERSNLLLINSIKIITLWIFLPELTNLA